MSSPLRHRRCAALHLKVNRLEETLRAVLGDEVDALFIGNTLLIEGLPGAMAMITTDLTWQRRSEAAVEARRALQRLIEQQQRVEVSLQASLSALRLRDSALGAISLSTARCSTTARTARRSGTRCR